MRPGSMTAQRWLACAVTAAGLAGVGLALADADTPLRTLLALLFSVAVPTMAAIGLLRGVDTFGRIFAAFTATVVINVLVAAIMLEAGIWSPGGGLVVVVVITALIRAVQLPVRRWANRYASAWRAIVRRPERL
jgi:multisubunit Na+/H+ antiporter MnhG subunit